MSRATVAITIGGVDKTTLVEDPCDYVNGFNGAVGVANLRVTDPSGAYTPAADAVVQITVGGTLRWAGEIAKRSVTEYGESGGVDVSLVCHDDNELLERGLINDIIPAGTLKAALQYLTNAGGALYVLGVTLDAGQATGPTLGVITAPWLTPRAYLEYLSTLTGWVFRISPTKVLKMWDPATASSGVTISRANENYVSASWDDERLDYRNRQWLIYGPSEIRLVSDVFNGDNTSRDFAARYQVAAPPGTVTLTDGFTTSVQPVGVYGVDAMEWTWDTAYGSYGGLRQKITSTPLTTSWLLTVGYTSQFPNYVFVQDAAEVTARGEWNKVAENADITDIDEATAYAAALIRTSVGRPQIPRVVTTADGIEAGTTVALSLSHIGLSVTAMVQAAPARLSKSDDQVWAEYDLDLVGVVSGAYENRATVEQLWRRVITGDVGGSSIGSGGSGGGGTTTVITGVRSHVWQNARAARVFSASWTSIGDYLPFIADTDAAVTVLIAQITNNAGGTVQARIYDETAAAAVTGTTTTATTSTSWSESTVIFTPTIGHRYVLQVIGGSASVGVGAVALS